MDPVPDNLSVYTNAGTVAYYGHLTGLPPCEQYAFAKYVHHEIDVLDLGVGGGRTTPYLSAGKRRYIGVDYSDKMVDFCRKQFPLLPFHTLNASNLSYFSSATFDAVVFSFNGIDYLHPDGERITCLSEVNRVLRSGGIFIFSVHNARVAFIRPQFHGADISRRIWRLIRAIGKSSVLLSTQLARKSFRDGIGYIVDPVHGGLLTHTSIPRFVKEELTMTNFHLLEVVSSNYPSYSSEFASPWYYYVAQKP